MKDSEKIMNLPKQLFWDVDYEKIDYDKKRIFVIDREVDFFFNTEGMKDAHKDMKIDVRTLW